MSYRTVFALCGVCAALVATTPAHASYTGLSVELYTTAKTSAGLKSVYRVYANFSSPSDWLTAVSGGGLVGTLLIQSRNSDDTAPGGNFFNPGASVGNTAPYLAQIDNDPDLEWGTFATIGVGIADQGSGGPEYEADLTGLNPGFPTFVNGNSLVSNNIGWFVNQSGSAGQNAAGYLGDGDPLLRVLIMQLAVNAGDNVRGTVTVGGANIGGLAAVFTAPGQTFNSIPAPSALGLLAMAGLLGTRRPRRQF